MTAWTRLFHRLWDKTLEARAVVNTTRQERISERRVRLPECLGFRAGESVEMDKTTTQERIPERMSKQSRVIEVPRSRARRVSRWSKLSLRNKFPNGVDLVPGICNSIPQERISEGMGKQSRIIGVPEISCR